MLFSSMSFVFLFMPLVCLAYLLLKKEVRNYFLLSASILFYGWGEPRYLAIMILTILINYCGAIGLSRHQKYKKIWLAVTIILDLSFLIYFKYFNFVLDNVNALFSMDMKFIDVIMPIGISFYTFQAMSYLMDVYRGEVKVQRDIYKLALYITLFPQLVAGPIVKYHDVDAQIDDRSVTFDKVSLGVKRFVIGLAKKMLLANTLGAVADRIFALAPDQFETEIAWLGAICYSLQLFYDFSGYSDMAIGLGLIFGFKFPENFNYPYISKSITEFWRRWHISLSTWFKEYLYIPLGGNRKSVFRTYVNLFIVFLATGLWHGANWVFIVWGLWHGLFIIIEKATGWYKEEKGLFINTLKHIYAILVFVIGWVIFRSETFSYAINFLKNMFGALQGKSEYEYLYYINRIEMAALVIGLICSVPVFKNILCLRYEHKIARSLVNIWLGVMFIVSSAAVAAATYNPFIYFRF